MVLPGPHDPWNEPLVRRFLPLIGLLAALLAPTTASAAEAGLNIAGGSAASAADVDVLSDTGAKWARHFLFWDDIDNAGLDQFGQVIDLEGQRGIKTLLVVAGKPDPDGVHSPPANPQAFADFMGMVAAKYRGRVEAYEVWNEADEGLWWRPGGNPAAYVDLLRRSYAKVKAADPGATVVFSPLTGANYGFVEAAYAAGAKGNFDAMGVHTDTACLIDSPYHYYRDQGRIARFTFLGVREVRASMLKNGDDKPVWITELGWAARANETCDSGAFAGKKAAGVSEQKQAQFLLEAFHCLDSDPNFGVQVAMWFTHRDQHYGLQRPDGSRRPAYDAFKSYTSSGDRLSGPCGDFVAPEIKILEPKPGTVIADRDSLRIRATSTDDEVLRMTFTVAGAGSEIRNFTNSGNPLDLAKSMPFLDWQGVRKLGFGKHRIVVTGLDKSGNEGRAEVEFQRINPAQLTKVAVQFPRRLKVTGKGRKRVLRGRITSALPYTIGGKIRVEWQNKRKGKWKKIHGGAKNANRPFAFRQKLKYKGQWRVRLVYSGKAPYKKTVSKWVRFRVR